MEGEDEEEDGMRGEGMDGWMEGEDEGKDGWRERINWFEKVKPHCIYAKQGR